MNREGSSGPRGPRIRRNPDGSLRFGSGRRSVGVGSGDAQQSRSRRASFLYRFFRIGTEERDKKDTDIGEIWRNQDMLRAEREALERKKDAELRAKWIARVRAIRDIPKKKSRGQQLHISISIPRLPAFFNKVDKKYYFAGMTALVLVIGGIAIVNSAKNKDLAVVAGVNSEQGVSYNLPKEKPSFRLYYPRGAEDQYKDLVRRVSPEDKPPVYVYVDNIGGIRILVSQQELPSSFKDDLRSQLKDMATQFQATSVILVDGQSIYHGISEKDGVQSIIFAKDDHLFLVKADAKLSDTQVSDYFLNLQ